ncbi:trypsin-like serine protease [Pseudobacteriovorax antillogorgiicola]|uniref:Trypsin n=1 Tax=Pseudobacteriovorax antillogorgiicola TaxID=1513793 RepID=A0A1Y6BTS5_9BACT|nr:trypsin-like serine protease [Pseudobacteriovorax antillogorgiicola]TCS52460.1 trypsin [Pseudobacteriovorax antillogorgiicola]SMF28436.1 Trypsin [Pseudobacteriovorax antillogorgiicola]
MTNLRQFAKVFSLSLGLGLGLSNCGTDTSSDVKVANGIEIPETTFPSVVLLYDQAGSICTGTFITEEIVLTAAHCSMSGDVNTRTGEVDLTLGIIEIEDAAEGKAKLVAQSTKIYRNPLWDSNGRNVNRYDLGVVYFPKGTARAVSDLTAGSARSGDEFTIVGYGLNQTNDLQDGSSAGIKRIGYNTVSSVSGGFIQFTGQTETTNGDGSDASSSSGDSGGPLFIDGELAGVTSGGGNSFGRARSLYIDIHSSTSKDFLGQFVNY